MSWWSTLLDLLFGPDDDEPGVASSSGGAVAVLEQAPPEAEARAWWVPQGPSVTEASRLARPPARRIDAVVFAATEALLTGPEIDLPHLPQIPQQVLTLLRQDSVSFQAVADVISRDQVLAAAVLGRANAAALGGRVKIKALQAALTRLGVRGLRSLMISQSVRHLTVTVGQGKSRGEALWKESLASGVVAALYNTCFSVCTEDAFLIGLLHDIGRVMVLRACHDAEVTTGALVSDELFEYLSQEYHQRLGHVLATHWQLPAQIARMAAAHHLPLDGQDQFDDVRALVQLTDASVSILGYGRPQPYDLLAMPAAQYLQASENAQFMMTLKTIPKAIEDAVTAL